MITDKQKWSQIRNWDKKMIMGAQAELKMIIQSETTTPAECHDLEIILNKLNCMIKLWDQCNIISKNLYLKKMAERN